MADKVISEIAGGAKPELKHAETIDKSAPVIDKSVKVKKVDREGFLDEVSKGKELKKAETVDKSAPVIGEDVKVKKNERPALLGDIQKGKDLKKTEGST